MALMGGISALYLGVFKQEKQSEKQKSVTQISLKNNLNAPKNNSQISPSIVSHTVSPPPTNLNTYTNITHKFTLQYPSNWKYLDVPNNSYPSAPEAVWFAPVSQSWPPVNTGAQPPVLIQFSQTENPYNIPTQYKSSKVTFGDLVMDKWSGYKSEFVQGDIYSGNVPGGYIILNASPETNPDLKNILSSFKFEK
jgi:hypothetical protein